MQGKELLAPGKSATAAEDKKVLIPVQVSSILLLHRLCLLA